MMKIVATNVIASRPPNGDRLQRCRLCQFMFVGDYKDKVVGGLGDIWLDIGDCQDLHKTVM